MNEEHKNLIRTCIDIVKTDNFKKSNEQKKNLLLKRCSICKKRLDSEDSIDCNKCGDGFDTKCVKETKNFKCDRCLGEVKTDSDETYK